METLEDFLLENQPEEMTESSAIWAVKKIKALQEELHKIENTARVEKERIDLWQETQSRIQQNQIDHFESKLQTYLIQQDKKTITFPHGEIKFRAQQKRFVYDEPLTEFVEKNNLQYLKIKKELDWAMLKKDIITKGGSVIHRITGEVLPIAVEEVPDKFSVKIYE